MSKVSADQPTDPAPNRTDHRVAPLTSQQTS
jgi:hypothetical protein